MLAIAPTTVAVTLLCGVLVIDRVLSIEQTALRNLTTSADMISIHVAAAMLFDDPAAGIETLLALERAPDVASARIYDDSGAVFASYARRAAPGPLPRTPLRIGHGSRDGWFTLTIPIMHKEKVLGTLTMADDMARWYGQLYRDILIVIGVGAVAFGCAVTLAVAYRRALMRPITSLAGTAKHVSQVQDYSVRAQKYSEDELGRLTDAFNEMLVQVQSRDIALELRATELANTNAELERFAYVASHDLQEPLRMVGSYLELIKTRYTEKLDSDGQEFIEYAVGGACRMKRLINDLLSLSRVDTRGQPFEPTDLNRVVDDVLANLKTSIEETKAVVTRDPLPTVQGDASQLGQLLQNLLGNAIKFHGAEAPRIHVGADWKDNHWVFRVTDNGIGIAPEYFERIFIIFQRLCKNDEYPGTGIGLAVCKKIVDRHGGRIWVESAQGQGATFYFTLHKERKAKHNATINPSNRDPVGRGQPRGCAPDPRSDEDCKDPQQPACSA